MLLYKLDEKNFGYIKNFTQNTSYFIHINIQRNVRRSYIIYPSKNETEVTGN